MTNLLHGLNKKRVAPMFVVGIIDVQQRMLGALFEGYIVSMYGFYNVVGHDFKYIHCDCVRVSYNHLDGWFNFCNHYFSMA
jgi:hypothetical protein